MTVVAAFDFDGTLTRRDTVVPFLRRIAGDGPLARSAARRAFTVLPAVATRDRDRLRQIATEEVFAGRSSAEVSAVAHEHAADIISGGLRPETVTALDRHLRSGHRVVIVSASYETYVHPVGRHLGVDAVLATRLETTGETCTGRLDGPNCRGAEKVVRLWSWFDDCGLDPAEVTLWAYGDSAGDREMLAAARHPHWIR